MLLWRVGVAFIFEHLQGGDEFGPGVARLDHLVDVAALGGYVGVGEFGRVFGNQFFAPLLRVGSFIDLIPLPP